MSNFEPRATDRADRLDATLVLGLLFVDIVLLAIVEAMFVTLSVGGTPVPISVLVALVSTPWSVRRAGELATGTPGAVLVFLGWTVVTMTLWLGGPGGDVLMPWSWPLTAGTWPPLALVLAGLLPGALTLGRVIRHRTDLNPST